VYVSDYGLELSCKDARCRAPSRVTQNIFAILVVGDYHVVLTRSFKLIIFYIYCNVIRNSTPHMLIRLLLRPTVYCHAIYDRNEILNDFPGRGRLSRTRWLLPGYGILVSPKFMTQ